METSLDLEHLGTAEGVWNTGCHYLLTALASAVFSFPLQVLRLYATLRVLTDLKYLYVHAPAWASAAMKEGLFFWTG